MGYMILKLTNTATGRKGQLVFINLDHIISIYPDEIDNKPVTVFYSNTKESWHVAESIETISKMIGLNNV
jgi:hypothetical protein